MTSKAANILISNYLHADFLYTYIQIYFKVLPVASAHHTDPSSGASQQQKKSHLDDDPHDEAQSQPGVPGEDLLC